MARCPRCKRSLGFGITACPHCTVPDASPHGGFGAGAPARAALPTLQADGVNGQLTLTATHLTIARAGFMALLGHGLNGDKVISLEHITSVQYKRAGSLTNGYLQVAFMGGHEAKGGYLQGATDENTVLFTVDQERTFHRLKVELERRSAAARATRTAPAPSAAPGAPSATATALDDLERLAALRDRGVLTDAEFEAKKRQLLGL